MKVPEQILYTCIFIIIPTCKCLERGGGGGGGLQHPTLGMHVVMIL